MVPLVVLSQFCFCHCFLCLLPPGSCRFKRRLILFLYFFSRVWSCFVLEPLWFSFETVMPTCFLKPLEFWRFCRHFCLKDLRSGMCLLDTLNGFFMAWIYRRSLEDTKSTASDLLNQLNLFLVPHRKQEVSLLVRKPHWNFWGHASEFGSPESILLSPVGWDADDLLQPFPHDHFRFVWCNA